MYIKEIAWSVDVDGCHICTSHRPDTNGYPQFKRDKKSVRLSRYVWAQANGPIPEGKHVLHTCDKRNCINPEHLYLGTHKDNMRDMAMRNRGTSKLTPDDVRDIRAKEDVYTRQEMAKHYNVCPQLIGKIQRGQERKYVT